MFLDTNENERNLEISGLVNFGSDPNFQTAPTTTESIDVCFKNIQINSGRITVGDIKMSSKVRLGCPSKHIIPTLAGSTPKKMIVRKPVELTVDEGNRISIKDFIPTVVDSKTMGQVDTFFRIIFS